MKKFKLINLIKTFATCLFLLTCVSAQAFQVVLDGSGTNATQILNLEIDGTFYDVTWVNADADITGAEICPGGVPGTTPCDLYIDINDPHDVGDQAGATAAATQIALALNEDVSIGGSGSPVVLTVGTGQLEVLVPWRFDVAACNGDIGGTQGTCAQNAIPGPPFGAGTWGILGIGDQEIQSTLTVDFARFAPAAPVVPIPAAAWLFGSALGMLGWVRRRARQAGSSNEAKASPMA
jgi:hypothetical protein